MNDLLYLAAVLAGSYLIGGTPFAYVVGRVFFHADIREHGSGNVGATNVYRVLGAWPAALVVALDMLKGFVPVALAGWLVPWELGDWLMIGAALAAVLGHTYTPFLGFSGGKGVATAAGALLRLTPLPVTILIVLFAIVVAVWRVVSVGSLVIAVLYPVTVLVFYGERPALIGMSVFAAALVVWRHRSNIERIIKGEEGRISGGRWKRTPEDDPESEEVR